MFESYTLIYPLKRWAREWTSDAWPATKRKNMERDFKTIKNKNKKKYIWWTYCRSLESIESLLSPLEWSTAVVTVTTLDNPLLTTDLCSLIPEFCLLMHWLLSCPKNEWKAPKVSIFTMHFEMHLCQVWMKLAPWFLRIRFINLVNVSLLFLLLSPLGKGRSLSFDALRKVWLKLAQWFWRKDENVKSLWLRRWTTDKFQSDEPSVQVS